MTIEFADIELINSNDLSLFRKNIIGDGEVRKTKVKMKADKSLYLMCINETIKKELGLEIVYKKKVINSNGDIEEFDVVGPIDIRFKNRKATCNAFVLRGDSEPLLGAIPMEEMDVLIHPLRQELIVNPEHPNYAVLKMK